MDTMTLPPRHRLLVLGALMAILVLAMALRLRRLDARSLRADELFTAKLVELDFRSIVDRTAKDVHPPLSYEVTRLFVVLFGDVDFVLRLPAALFGTLSILVIYKLGEALWTRSEGIVAAGLLAVNPYHLAFSQFARHYALLIFLSSLSLLLLLKALESGRKVLWLGFGLTAALDIYNVYFAFFPLAGQLLFAAWVLVEERFFHKTTTACTERADSASRDSRVGRQALMLVLSIVLVGALFVPWLPIMVRQLSGQEVGWEGLGGPSMPGFEFSVDYVHLWLNRYSGVDGAALVLFLTFFAVGLASCRRKEVLPVAFSIAMAVAFPLLVRATHRFRPEYAIFVLPIYLLAIARGIVFAGRLAHRAYGRSRACSRHLASLTPSVALVLFWCAMIPRVENYYAENVEDWRGAARYLAESMLPDDVILADGRDYGQGRDHGRVRMGLSRYLHAYAIESTPILQATRGISRDLHRVGARGGELHAVIWYPDRPMDWATHEQITVVDFDRISLIRLREPSGVVFQDTVSMLRVLLELLPPEARFDVHLALAEIYGRTGQFDRVESELELASQVKPDHQRASLDLADARAEWKELSCSIESMRHLLWRNVGHVLAFLGHDIHSASLQAGATLKLALWWQALGDMDRDYSVFVHVVDQDDRIWAQHDELLVHDEDPTSTWLPGDIVKGEHDLQLPPDTPPGEYTVKTGIYYWETGERLLVWDQDAQGLREDAIVLDRITVTR